MSHPSSSLRGWCAAAAATALAASTIVAASAPAGAAPGENQGNIVFRDHFSFDDSHIEQEEHGDEFCTDIPFLVLWEGRGTITDMFMVRQGDRYFGSFKVTNTNTYTNLETGVSFHDRSSFGWKDQKIEIDEDGILTATWQDRLGWKLFDQNGKLVGVDAGMVRYTATVDLHDLDDPEDDEELSFEVLADHGTRQLGDRDFCEDLMTFLG